MKAWIYKLPCIHQLSSKKRTKREELRDWICKQTTASPRRTKELQPVTSAVSQDGQDLVNDCQTPCFILPQFPTWNHPKKAKYILQVNHLRCSVSSYFSAFSLLMPIASNHSIPEASPTISLFSCKAFFLLCLPLTLCQKQEDGGLFLCKSKCRINKPCSFSFGWSYLFLQSYIDDSTLLKSTISWEFHGGPVIMTPCFYCRGHGFSSWLGN